MSARNYTFADLLAQLKYNVSRTTLSESPGITQIRKEMARFSLASPVETSTAWGTTYFTHPVWNTTPTFIQAFLKHWWTLASFETSTGSGNVRPSSGTLAGTIVGSPTITSEVDLSINNIRRYVNFGGSGDYINLGDITVIDAGVKYTVGFRFRATNLSINYTLLARWPSANANKQILIRLLTNGNIQVTRATDVVGGTAVTVTTGAPISAATWYTLNWVYNTSATPNGEILINGVSVAQTDQDESESLEYSTSDVNIARRGDDTSEDFVGDIYDVVMWNTNLTNAQGLVFHNDVMSESIASGLWKTPGDLDTYDTATSRTIAPDRSLQRKRGVRVYSHQITSQV